MTTAYNEETGETLELRNGEWVAAATPSEVNLQGGGRGRLGWVGDTPELTQRLNTAEPADAFAVGALGGALAGPSVALGAGFGALSGVMGAEEGEGVKEGLIGAALGGPVGKLAGVAMNAAADPIARAAQQAMGLAKGIPGMVADVAENVSTIGPPIGRMRTRIKNEGLLKLAERGLPGVGAGSAPVRARSSLLDPSELARTLNIPEESLTPAQRAMLTYTEGQADELGPVIGKALEDERNAVYTQTAGEDVANSWRNIDTAFTRKVTDEAGIPYGQVADPGIISQTRREVGQDIGKVLEENFPDSFVALKPEYSIARVINSNTDTEVAPAMRILKNYGAVKVGDDGATDVAEMSIERFTKMKSELQKVSDSTTNPNVRMATDKVIQQLDNNAVDGMNGEARDAYSKLKYKYKLLSKMQEPGVVSPDGMINPKSFGKQWTRGESKNMRHTNELAKLADTINAITSKATAGTTGGRSFTGDISGAAGSAVGRMIGL